MVVQRNSPRLVNALRESFCNPAGVNVGNRPMSRQLEGVEIVRGVSQKQPNGKVHRTSLDGEEAVTSPRNWKPSKRDGLCGASESPE